ncbi:MAG: DNA polymerase III subunit delta [Fidelibacterota bacterium]|nr:MAG: DNA polymerase III subunit delta [Candidatus Neomarinimicrobiota bacterium]
MLSYSDAIRQVKAEKISPVYLLVGGDAFFEDFFSAEVTARFLPEGSRKSVYSLDDDRAEQVLAELSAYTLFQQRQVMVVRQVQRIAGTARDELLAYVKTPDPDKCLLLIMEEHQPSRGLQKSLAKSVPIVDARPPFPDKLRSWANYYAKLKGYTIQPEALELLMELVGDSAGHVVGELDKIFTQLTEGETVTREIVELHVAPVKSYQLWQLQEAVARHEAVNALRITVSLMEYGVAPTRIVGSLATLFSQLLFHQTGTTAKQVYTGLNKSITAQLGSMSNHYTLNETFSVLRKLLATDVSLKSTGMDPNQLLTGLVADICRGQP